MRQTCKAGPAAFDVDFFPFAAEETPAPPAASAETRPAPSNQTPTPKQASAAAHAATCETFWELLWQMVPDRIAAPDGRSTSLSAANKAEALALGLQRLQDTWWPSLLKDVTRYCRQKAQLMQHTPAPLKLSADIPFEAPSNFEDLFRLGIQMEAHTWDSMAPMGAGELEYVRMTWQITRFGASCRNRSRVTPRGGAI